MGLYNNFSVTICSLTKPFKSCFTENFLHGFKVCTSICAETSCLGAVVELPQGGGTQGSGCCYLVLYTGNLQTNRSRLWFIFLLLNFAFLSQTPEKNILNHWANWFPLRHPGRNWKLNSLLTFTLNLVVDLVFLLTLWLHFAEHPCFLSPLLQSALGAVSAHPSGHCMSNAILNFKFYPCSVQCTNEQAGDGFYWGRLVLWKSWFKAWRNSSFRKKEGCVLLWKLVRHLGRSAGKDSKSI